MSHIRSFTDPLSIARHPQLKPEAKRAILASWSSDRLALKGAPALRRPPGARNFVPVNDGMEALRWLDTASVNKCPTLVTSDRNSAMNWSPPKRWREWGSRTVAVSPPFADRACPSVALSGGIAGPRLILCRSQAAARPSPAIGKEP